jgi:hypothetical protein
MVSSLVVDVIVHSEGRRRSEAVDAGVSSTYRSQCRPGTGAASGRCRAGTGASVSPTYRNFTLEARDGRAMDDAEKAEWRGEDPL